MDNSTCMELALEGERLCKAGDCQSGVAFFEAAIQSGTSDLKTLSAIYSQLGNAYFYMGDYLKAMEYHKHDLTLARSINDRMGEAKASGNLGNTLKVMGQFDEAMICCRRHLEISQELSDKVGEGRSLYNLGNVYHAKGKHIGRLGHQDPGEFPEEVKACLQKAVEYYEANLKLMVELGDRSAQGRACGNLGNTHYLLGNFNQAITYHEERLKIAKEFGDKPAERRAHSNLGNAYVFLGEFETAATHYKHTLILAQELGDRAVEAQACYSLGNTYTLLRDYPTAIEFHKRHLRIAQELVDKIGEARACWSLGNAHSAVGNHEKALQYANRHLEIAKEIGDPTGQATAQMTLADLRRVLGLHQSKSLGSREGMSVLTDEAKTGVRRCSVDSLERLKQTPGYKMKESWSCDANVRGDAQLKRTEKLPPVSGSKMDGVNEKIVETAPEEENFFDILSRFQSKRMDDQRCALHTAENKENERTLGNHVGSLSSSSSGNTNASSQGNSRPPSGSPSSASSEAALKVKEDLLDLIAGMQSKRLDEQRASLPQLPGLNNNNPAPLLHRFPSDDTNIPDDSFFDMLMRCQGTRIEDQRSVFPAQRCSAPTVPDDDFFSLIVRLQSGRIEDQRSSIPVKMPMTLSGPGSTQSTGSGILVSRPKTGFRAGRASKNKR